MQYILTQEEYDELQSKLKDSRKLPTTKELQDTCTRIANTFVLTKGWAKGEIWKCILTEKREHYCDECPVSDICPHPNKEWSK